MLDGPVFDMRFERSALGNRGSPPNRFSVWRPTPTASVSSGRPIRVCRLIGQTKTWPFFGYRVRHFAFGDRSPSASEDPHGSVVQSIGSAFLFFDVIKLAGADVTTQEMPPQDSPITQTQPDSGLRSKPPCAKRTNRVWRSVLFTAATPPVGQDQRPRVAFSPSSALNRPRQR